MQVCRMYLVNKKRGVVQMSKDMVKQMFGKTSGFAFSNEDLLAARAELIDKVNSNK